MKSKKPIEFRIVECISRYGYTSFKLEQMSSFLGIKYWHRVEDKIRAGTDMMGIFGGFNTLQAVNTNLEIIKKNIKALDNKPSERVVEYISIQP